MSYIFPKDRTDPKEIKARIAELRKLIRRTEWRSEAYRSKIEIELLQARLKEIKELNTGRVKRAVALEYAPEDPYAEDCEYCGAPPGEVHPSSCADAIEAEEVS